MLAALSSPHRLRIVAALQASGRNYVSQLARDLGLSREHREPGMGKNNLQVGIFTRRGNAQRGQSEGHSGAGVHHCRNAQSVGGREDKVAIF